ncbi:DUF5644 domain-containing protein, partial [Campylobacter coli]|nr:DUF5644 domain-containing protein [Campylobacter coli]
FDKDEDTYIVVNKQIIPLFTPLEKIAKEFDFNLCIEPLSTKRAIKDLIIDKNDFLDKYKYLEKFGDEEDKKLYAKYDYLYYATEILDYLPEYMGDAVFYLTSKMIEKYPDKKIKILKTICDTQKGIFYHLASKNEDLENTIKNLQKEIIDLKLINEAALEFDLPKINAFDNEIKELGEVKYDFDNFNIACYGFKIKDDIKSKIKAHFISYENSNKNNGFSLLQLNPELSYKMAANIILDAYDSGADFMVVNQAKDFYMFDTCSKKLMQSSGREFKDFYVLSYFEFLSLIQGIKNPSLQNHNLKVSLI